jgi:hypothetical protein
VNEQIVPRSILGSLALILGKRKQETFSDFLLCDTTVRWLIFLSDDGESHIFSFIIQTYFLKNPVRPLFSILFLLFLAGQMECQFRK